MSSIAMTAVMFPSWRCMCGVEVRMGMILPSRPIQIGYRFFHGVSQPFFLENSDRRQHLYCIGKTGTGKSTLLRNLIVQDILAGNGVGVVDPHGDLAESILDSIPSWRVEDVVYFNPADTENPGSHFSGKLILVKNE